MKNIQILGVERLKRTLPVGTRLELTEDMDDIQGLKSGSQGVVSFIDDIGTIHMKWDNGSTLGIVHNVDKYNIINLPEREITEVDHDL